LRQEFRELELLDEITKLRYLGQVPPTIVGVTRNELIHSFRKWKGEQYMPPAVHTAIGWSEDNPFPVEDQTKDSPWTVIGTKANSGKEPELPKTLRKDTTGFVVARGTQALQSLNNTGINRKDKRKRDEESSKKFCGFPWDPVNWSCAYDSLLTVLMSVYMECKPIW
ncbi:hypothetical protein L227DRAFT_477521, partial [Lentinus tigrinus ALCF2SS1-6]